MIYSTNILIYSTLLIISLSPSQSTATAALIPITTQQHQQQPVHPTPIIITLLKRIEMDEELAGNELVLNLTEHIHLANTNRTRQIESIKFELKGEVGSESSSFQLHDYFQIETKKTRYPLVSLDLGGVTTSPITHHHLRTSSRALDREYLCRLSSLRAQCSCELECVIHLDLVVNNDERMRLPILVRDLNDNRPFFYTKELKIELDLTNNPASASVVRIPIKEAIDLDSMAKNRVREYKVDGGDGAVRVEMRTKERLSGGGGGGEEEGDKPRLSLIVDWSMQNNVESSSEGSRLYSKRIKLLANDPDFTATQTLSIQLKLPLTTTSPPTTNPIIKSDNAYKPNAKLTWLNLVNFVSALDELDITAPAAVAAFTNQTNSHEIIFRHTDENDDEDNKNIKNGDGEDTTTEQTLAYLIVEKSKLMTSSSKANIESSTITVESEQLMDDVLVTANSSVFRVNEMRSGLYAIATKAAIYRHIKHSQSATVNETNKNSSIYKMRLTIRFNNLKLVKQLSIRVPSDLIAFSSSLKLNNRQANIFTKHPASATKVAETSRRRLLSPLSGSPTSSPTTNLNLTLYNSVVVVSIASAILVVFGLACFTISLVLYFTSKCSKKNNKSSSSQKQKKLSAFFQQQQNTPNKSAMTGGVEESSNIIVYDMPIGNNVVCGENMVVNAALKMANNKQHNNKQTVYSLASSLSSESTCDTNNISPVTTTTTSIQGGGGGSCNGPLFQTHLDTHQRQQQQQQALTAAAMCSSGGGGGIQSLGFSAGGQEAASRNHVFEWFMQQQQQQQNEIARFNFLKNNNNKSEQSSTSSSSSSSSPLSVSSSTNLIKPLETTESLSSTTSSISKNTIQNNISSSHKTSQLTDETSCGGDGDGGGDENANSNSEKYKNDLYRSSHQIFYKQQLFQQNQQHHQYQNMAINPYLNRPKISPPPPQTQQQQPLQIINPTDSEFMLIDSSNTITTTTNNNNNNLNLLYEAKPLNSNTNMTMWTSLNSSVIERDQMIDRLSAAIANLTNSSSSTTNTTTNTPTMTTSVATATTNKTSDDATNTNMNEIRQISCV